jgi:hypothetical protein
MTSPNLRPAPLPKDRLLRRVNEDIDSVKRQQDEITRKLADARAVLVREAVSVFGLRKGLSKQGHWEIAGLSLPSPELFRREFTGNRQGSNRLISSLSVSPDQCRSRPYHTPLISHHSIPLGRATVLSRPDDPTRWPADDPRQRSAS